MADSLLGDIIYYGGCALGYVGLICGAIWAIRKERKDA